ncbi:MAG: hypothetical protein C0504_11070 [Candidatus Solibacter sp.]|nr:hypothetical protein [Candidatus Solibacter sp.]
MKRRAFLLTPTAVAAAQFPAASAPPDSVTNAPGLEYYLIGNGQIMAGIQSTATPAGGTQAGIVLMSSERLNRKHGSLLWHPRSGLDNTRIAVWVDAKPYLPQPGEAHLSWRYPDGIPTVRVEWVAGACRVVEDLYCPIGEPALVRRITVVNRGGQAVQVRAVASLRPNPVLMDEFEIDPRGPRLSAGGYHHIELAASPGSRIIDRQIEIPFGILPAGASAQGETIVSVDRQGSKPVFALREPLRAASARYWSRLAGIQTGAADFDRLFRMASHGYRATVAASGKMDGGPWGYNLEWVRDACMAAAGSTMAGLHDAGAAALDRILTRLINEDGAALDSGSHRGSDIIELDQNGYALHAVWTHWAWTGDDGLIRKHWPKIRATADFPLNPIFRDARTGLVHNSREFWERHPFHGIRDGYESAYQVWNIAGWRKAAELARLMGEPECARRWTDAAALMERSFLGDPRFSFIENGRLIKRRLVSGEVQATLDPPNREALPPGMPLRVERVSYCDPDSSAVFPMLLGMVDPKGDVARRTLESMETLWNQRWQHGGYGRYHVTGEADSPGPWPFASLFIARAYLEAGDSEKVWRIIRWLNSVPGGNSGAWFEFYGPRPIPPLPPVAVMPWTWAEIVTLAVHHVLGVRPDGEGVTIRPRLLDGMDGAAARLTVNGHALRLNIRRGGGAGSARVGRREVAFDGDALRIPRPVNNTEVELQLGGA